MQVNGIAIPATMAEVGPLYKWSQPQPVAKNGRGRVVVAGYPSLVWGWTWLTDSNMNYWLTTILAGQPDALCTALTQLYDHRKVLRNISSCVVYEPVFETITNGVYHNVQLYIGQIVVSS